MDLATERGATARNLVDPAVERLTHDEIRLILELFAPAFCRLTNMSSPAPVEQHFPRLRQIGSDHHQRAAHPSGGPRVIIVDDSKLSRECLQAQLVAHNVDASCAWDLESLLSQFGLGGPGVVLVNANTRDAQTLLTMSLERGISSRVIVYGVDDERPQELLTYAGAGVLGIHLNSESFEHLLRLINEVPSAGKVVCSPRVSAILMKNTYLLAKKTNPAMEGSVLSAREKEILELLEAGLSNQQIATRLSVTVHTVKNHVHKVLSKLGVSTRSEAAAHSRSMKLGSAIPGL